MSQGIHGYGIRPYVRCDSDSEPSNGVRQDHERPDATVPTTPINHPAAILYPSEGSGLVAKPYVLRRGVPPPMPDVGQLAGNAAVQDAIARAWAASFLPNGAVIEQGGWVYWNPKSGDIQTRLATGGDQSSLEALGNPELIPGWIVVGTFHTHPNPLSAGFKIEPSSSDRWFGFLRGVPGLVATEYGLYSFGPPTRPGDKWQPGFPH